MSTVRIEGSLTFGEGSSSFLALGENSNVQISDNFTATEGGQLTLLQGAALEVAGFFDVETQRDRQCQYALYHHPNRHVWQQLTVRHHRRSINFARGAGGIKPILFPITLSVTLTPESDDQMLDCPTCVLS